jgi:hypothetical protein
MTKKSCSPFRISLLAIAKNEERYIKEFIEFYLIKGIEHFYFYDNESDLPLTEFLKEYSQICTINTIKGDIQQINAYNHFLKNYRNETEWVAVFDIDEFILLKKHQSLKQFIEANNTNDCISINWVMFGNGKHINRPEKGLLIENYLYSEGKQHPNVKSISKTKSIKKFEHPHFPKLKLFKKHVNALGNRMKGADNYEPTTHIIQLNHYFTKSLEEYQAKLNSKRADNGRIRSQIKEDMEWLSTEPERCSVAYDDEIFRKYGLWLKNNIKLK